MFHANFICVLEFWSMPKLYDAYTHSEDGTAVSSAGRTGKCRALVDLPPTPVKCRLDVSWNLHQCLVIVIPASVRHFGDFLPSSGNCRNILVRLKKKRGDALNTHAINN